MRQARNSAIAILLSFCFFQEAKGQMGIVKMGDIPNLPFLHLEADSISNVATLLPFFDKLYQLQRGDSIRINIVQIGDSHIQADYLTREVRKNFQLEFGNAGRGLVFPLKLAHTNEPSDFKSTSLTKWNSANIISPVRNPEPGISGVSIHSDKNAAFFDLTTFDHDGLDYSFDKVSLFHTKDSLQFDCRISDSIIQESYLMSSSATITGDCVTKVTFGRPTNHVRIQTEQCSGQQSGAAINGIVLEKSCRGILYHSIGINGARYADYNGSPLFFSQLQLLKPDLIILSMGTNEGTSIKINEEEMMAAVTGMISTLKASNPETCILITTPTDSYFRKKYKNPYLKIVWQALLKSAGQSDVACYDMYTVAGGYGSCTAWRKQKMLRPDGVHFTKEGYALQGSILYKALIDSYKKYASD